MLERPRQYALAEFGYLLAVLQDDRVLADQVDPADVAIEVDSDAGPVQPRGHLLDVRGLAGAMIALDHDASVVGKASRNRHRGFAVELIGCINVRNVLGTHRKRRNVHVDIDAEGLPGRDLGIRNVDLGGRAGRGDVYSRVHSPAFPVAIPRKSNVDDARRKGSGRMSVRL